MNSRKPSFTSPIKEVTFSISSPDMILQRSHGEVTEPETINHRTFRPEEKGLFCERIFGPNEDWTCACGKYKGIKYKLNVCDRCGVEVNERKVRRERLGHIKLAAPVVHPWYFKSLPNKIGALLGIPSKKLESIIYYSSYVVIKPGIKAADDIERGDTFSVKEYQVLLATLPKGHDALSEDHPDRFVAKMGAEAVEVLLKELNLNKIAVDLRDQLVLSTSQQERNNLLRRLRMIEAFRKGQQRVPNEPAWMVMHYVPVISPELRPVLPLESGHFAMSDHTTLYRQLITRNNRLKDLTSISAPDMILRQEKRLLQEAFNALYDNSAKNSAMVTEGGRPLKSLSQTLTGKQGRFRSNLLGKRVDYSGRSVIVAGPHLKLHECGLPKHMAAELFKPFIIHGLIRRGIAGTAKDAKKLIDSKDPVIWDILENQIKDHPVLLNRAPTLHRLSIQAFYPKLIEGKAIQLHPLVCAAFNADFDGDQMAVHVPLGQKAIAEAISLMLSTNNILNPANGLPIAVPTKDMVLGLYYLTQGRANTSEHPVKGEGMCFADMEEVTIALNSGCLDKHAHIKVRLPLRQPDGTITTQLADTVAGRIIFNSYIPAEMGFYNELITSKKLQQIIAEVYKQTDNIRTSQLLDDLKDLGFKYCYEGGLTCGLEDIRVPQGKETILKKADEEVAQIKQYYKMGYITSKERYNQIVDTWTHASVQISNALNVGMRSDKQGFNNFYMMKESGARGSNDQMRQLGGMRGLMAKPQKLQGSQDISIIEDPIKANFYEGLDPGDYFISTHGARKGLTDRALKTADAGYMTRKAVNAAQSFIVTEEDCGTFRGTKVNAIYDKDGLVDSLSNQIIGRTTLEPIHHPITGDLLVEANTLVTKEIAYAIEQADIECVYIRSITRCKAAYGICIKCYGLNLATQQEVEIGEAIGIIAAQSISEPGTQLTMRTFQGGGAASTIAADASIKAGTAGLIRFENIKTVPVKNNKGETVDAVVSKMGEVRILDPKSKQEQASYYLPYGAFLVVKEGEQATKGQELCYWDPYNRVIISEFHGKVAFQDVNLGVTYKEEYDEQTGHTEKIIIDPKERNKIPTLLVTDEQGQATSYILPTEAHLAVATDEVVTPGQVLAKIPQLGSQSRDITGGLKLVSRTLETTEPINASIVTAVDGVVRYGGIKRNAREITVLAKDGTEHYYNVPLSKHLLVQDGDPIKAGTPLSDGVVSIAKILEIQGIAAAENFIIKTIQDVYRMQGIAINNKHLEPFIRQMMRKVAIKKGGDTLFLPLQLVDKKAFLATNKELRGKQVITAIGDTSFTLGELVPVAKFNNENDRMTKQGLKLAEARDAKPAIASPKVQGITRSTLEQDSPLATVAFQETTKRLSNAAFSGSRDELKGIIERVVLGLKIPAGTGLRSYEDTIVTAKEDYQAMSTPVA